MIYRYFRFSIAISILAFADVAGSAPPEVTALFPAGAQRGTTVEVVVQGKSPDETTRVWASQRSLSVKIPPKSNSISVSVSPDAQPGVAWMRFFNSEGSSALRPFVIGVLPEIAEVEPNDDLKNAQAISAEAVIVNGQHAKNGDADSFAVRLNRGQSLVASLMASQIIGSNQDAVIQVVGPGGFVIAQNQDDQGFDPQLAFTAPADGTYYLRTWSLPMAPDSSIRLFGSPNSIYRMTVTTGPFVDRVMPFAIEAGVATRLELHGWNIGNGLANVESPVSATDSKSKLMLPDWFNRLPIRLPVVPHQSLIEHEPNSNSQPEVVGIPFSITGQIASKNDADVFQFAGKKGQRFRFEVLARELGSQLDPVIRIYDSKGTVLKESDDDGKESADPETEYVLPSDGDFRVSIFDRFAHGGERFFYLLNVTESLPDFTLSLASDSFVLKSDAELSIPVTVNRVAGFSGEVEFNLLGLPSGVTVTAPKSEAKGESAKSVTLKLTSTAEFDHSGPIVIEGRAASGGPFLARQASAFLKPFGTEATNIWLTVVAAKK